MRARLMLTAGLRAAMRNYARNRDNQPKTPPYWDKQADCTAIFDEGRKIPGCGRQEMCCEALWINIREGDTIRVLETSCDDPRNAHWTATYIKDPSAERGWRKTWEYQRRR